jgi:hypothetical protein
LIEAVLQSPLRDDKGAILAPDGARIHGRLGHRSIHAYPGAFPDVGLRLDSVEVNGAQMPIYAVLVQRSQPPSGSARDDHEVQFSDLLTLPRNVGVFFFIGKHLHVREWDSVWITTAPEFRKDTQQQLPEKTPQQISDREVANKLILAIHYSQQATDLLNAMPPKEKLADYSKLPDILTYRQKAIEVGASIDINTLNNLFPGLGN